MSCYLFGSEIVTSSLILLCVMDFMAHPLTQRLLFGLWLTICMEMVDFS